MPNGTPIVIIIDDDAAIRESLEDLLQSVGRDSRSYASVAAFLEAGLPDAPCCLILDVRMPGQSGLELQEQLVAAAAEVPIIFITGHADVEMSVRAMKAGAAEFLPKPFRHQDLLEAVQQSLEKNRETRRKQGEATALQRKFDALTAREKEVLTHVTNGRLNKQIAGDMGVAEITVKVHRGQVMKKMGARSLAALVRMADQLGLTPQP